MIMNKTNNIQVFVDTVNNIRASQEQINKAILSLAAPVADVEVNTDYVHCLGLLAMAHPHMSYEWVEEKARNGYYVSIGNVLIDMDYGDDGEAVIVND